MPSRKESSGAKSAPTHADGPAASEVVDSLVALALGAEESGVGTEVEGDVEVEVEVEVDGDVALVDDSLADSAPAHADSARVPATAPIAPTKNALREVMGPKLAPCR